MTLSQAVGGFKLTEGEDMPTIRLLGFSGENRALHPALENLETFLRRTGWAT